MSDRAAPRATTPRGIDRLKRAYSEDGARRRQKVAEVIAAQILDSITEKGLIEGDPLMSEAAMLQTYDGGRGTIREALRILETSGLITIKPGPGGGAVVGCVDPVHFGRTASRYFQMGGATIRDLIEARLILEPAATALAARRRSPEDTARLQAWLDHNEALDVKDLGAYLGDSHDFHSLLLGMSGNVILDLLSLSMKDVFNSRVHSAVYPQSVRKKVRGVHREIARLVLAGDADGAASLMREHLEEFAAYAARRLPGLMDDVVTWQ